MRRRFLAASLIAGLAWAAAALPGAASPALAAKPPLTVFGAASLTDAMKALGAQWQQKTGQEVRYSFAASSTLARQIEAGAPAEVFGSADEQWMDYLQQRQLIDNASRVDLLGNSLVLIAPKNNAKPETLTKTTDLAALLGADGRIATGDPAHVPVGIYAQKALTWMGQWDALNPRLARADSVRSALLLVERGEAPYGIVYGTDAAVAPNVAVVATFPAESHPPVSYPFALTKAGADNADAKAFLAFLGSAEAKPTWEKFGFTTKQ